MKRGRTRGAAGKKSAKRGFSGEKSDKKRGFGLGFKQRARRDKEHGEKRVKERAQKGDFQSLS
jgi:hypothetical protein